jgi:hypothetical protein
MLMFREKENVFIGPSTFRTDGLIPHAHSRRHTGTSLLQNQIVPG